MVFDVKNKVALITGGASGLGFEYAKELLRNGARGVALADINYENGDEAVKEILSTFGPGKAIFVKTDVTSYEQFEGAFLETIKKFKNVDILINNAGILNDAVWEKEILINVNGTIHGTLLGIEKYLPNYKTGEHALIVNISSITGVQGYGFIPVYSGTKHAIIGLVRSWGIPEFYEQTKVRVIGVCPGVTMTPLITEMDGRNLGGKYQEYFQIMKDVLITQEPEFMGKEVIRVIKLAPNGTCWIIEGGQPAYEYPFLDRTNMEHKGLPSE